MAENSVCTDHVEQICIMNDDKINGFRVLEKIDEGAYGQVFKVSKNSKKYAMKVEPNRLDGGQSTIKKEIEIMLELNRQDAKFFPKFVSGGMEMKFHMIVMTLLGDNLKKLRQKSHDPNTCSTGTWSRIGIQCLFVVKQMHDCGLLHHDLKPANFVMGHSDEILTNRIFHLIDFGISRKFVRSRKGAPLNIGGPQTDLEIRQPKKVQSLKGTPIYTSPNAHAMTDLGRIDDIWSLLYMIAELVKPLPWDQLEGKQLEKVKLKTKLKELFDNDAFEVVEETLRSSNFYSFPPYELVFNTFKSVYDKSKCSWLDPYDWETKQMPSYIKWRQHAEVRNNLFPWEYTEITSYFQKDPWIIIQKATDKGEKKKKKTKKNDKRSKEVADETLTTEGTCEEIINVPIKKPPKRTELRKAVFPK